MEYSVSASLMTIAIAVEVGITDAYTLMCMFVLMSSCMWFGLIAETTQKALPHLAGWIAFVIAYVPILDAYFTSINNSPVKPPDFVTAIVFAEFGIFALFGIVQLLSLLYPDPGSQLMQEKRFITLSIVAKSLLAWVVLGPTIQASKS